MKKIAITNKRRSHKWTAFICLINLRGSGYNPKGKWRLGARSFALRESNESTTAWLLSTLITKNSAINKILTCLFLISIWNLTFSRWTFAKITLFYRYRNAIYRVSYYKVITSQEYFFYTILDCFRFLFIMFLKFTKWKSRITQHFCFLHSHKKITNKKI